MFFSPKRLHTRSSRTFARTSDECLLGVGGPRPARSACRVDSSLLIYVQAYLLCAQIAENPMIAVVSSLTSISIL